MATTTPFAPVFLQLAAARLRSRRPTLSILRLDLRSAPWSWHTTWCRGGPRCRTAPDGDAAVTSTATPTQPHFSLPPPGPTPAADSWRPWRERARWAAPSATSCCRTARCARSSGRARRRTPRDPQDRTFRRNHAVGADHAILLAAGDNLAGQQQQRAIGVVDQHQPIDLGSKSDRGCRCRDEPVRAARPAR